MTFWLLLHLLSLCWLMLGLGAVVVPIWRAWANPSLDAKVLLLNEAQRSEAQWLVPGIIATLFSGVGLATVADMNVITTGWLLAKVVIYLVDVTIFLPLMGVGLRRARYLSLQAQKRGEMTPELRDALADKVPLVFGTVIFITIPILVALGTYTPF